MINNMSDIIDRAYMLRRKIESMTESTITDDVESLDYIELFPIWNPNGTIYIAGYRVRYGNNLYKVLQEHTSQEAWNPVDAPSLFAKVLVPDANVIPEWEQPDSTNGYVAGDKVIHNGKIWKSNIDNNVWEPGVTGTESLWIEVME